MLVLAIGVVMLFAGALTAGITIDEPVEAESTQSWLDHGWFDPPYVLRDGEPDPENPLSNPYVHGPAFGALAHAANVIAGHEQIGEMAYSAGAFTIRHLVSAVLAALAVAATGIGVWLLTRSRRLGLWAAAGLVAVPEWVGQGFFNPKDTPAASGYTLVTVALLIALSDESGDHASKRRLTVGAMLAAGIFIGAGTRPALMLPFLASVLVYAALRIGQARLGGIHRAGETDLAVAAGTGIGYAAIAGVYPLAAKTPVTFLIESVSSSTSWSWHGVTLTAGQLLSEHPPWWYLPAWFGASYPLLLGALALVGGALGVATVVKASSQGGWRGPIWHRADLGLLMVLQQALLLPLGAIVTGAVIYSDMRQHIYVLPAFAILAGVGAARLWSWSASRRPTATWRRATTALLAAALVIPVAEQVLLFPYNYTYINPIASIGGVNERWETDYWIASLPEALSRVPREAELRCFLVAPTVPCEESTIKPYEDQRGTAVADRWQGDTSAIWAIVRIHAGNAPPEYCEQVDDVTRWLRGEQVTMSYVLRCDPERLTAESSPR